MDSFINKIYPYDIIYRKLLFTVDIPHCIDEYAEERISCYDRNFPTKNLLSTIIYTHIILIFIMSIILFLFCYLMTCILYGVYLTDRLYIYILEHVVLHPNKRYLSFIGLYIAFVLLLHNPILGVAIMLYNIIATSRALHYRSNELIEQVSSL